MVKTLPSGGTSASPGPVGTEGPPGTGALDADEVGPGETAVSEPSRGITIEGLDPVPAGGEQAQASRQRQATERVRRSMIMPFILLDREVAAASPRFGESLFEQIEVQGAAPVQVPRLEPEQAAGCDQGRLIGAQHVGRRYTLHPQTIFVDRDPACSRKGLRLPNLAGREPAPIQ
jgi:hypothetical protein